MGGTENLQQNNEMDVNMTDTTRKCQCGYILESTEFQFCPKCGRSASDEKIAHNITMCDCCDGKIDQTCSICGTNPTPLTQEQFNTFVSEFNLRYKQICEQEYRMRGQHKALSRLRKLDQGIDCDCNKYVMCGTCGANYD